MGLYKTFSSTYVLWKELDGMCRSILLQMCIKLRKQLGKQSETSCLSAVRKAGVTSEECGCRVRPLNLDGVFITKGQTEENLGTLSIKVSLHADG